MPLPELFENRMKGHELAAQKQSVNGQPLVILLRSHTGDILLAIGEATPTDGGVKFAKGCFFICNSAPTATSPMFLNTDNPESCAFRRAVTG